MKKGYSTEFVNCLLLLNCVIFCSCAEVTAGATGIVALLIALVIGLIPAIIVYIILRKVFKMPQLKAILITIAVLILFSYLGSMFR